MIVSKFEAFPKYQTMIGQWRKAFTTEPDSEYRWRVEHICDDVVDSLGPGAIVLDIGCGEGVAVEYLWRRGVAAYGIEPEEKAVEECKRLCLPVEQGSVYDEPIARTSSGHIGALMLDVIEHLMWPEKALTNLDIDTTVELLWISTPIRGDKMASSGFHLREWRPDELIEFVEGCTSFKLEMQAEKFNTIHLRFGS